MTNIYGTFYLIQDRETPKVVAKFDNLKDAEIVAFSLNGDFAEYNFYVMSEDEVLADRELKMSDGFA